MNWFTGAVLYVLIWWVVLFAVLPIGAAPVAEADEQSGWRGAPSRPRLGRRALATTLLATAIWIGAYFLITSGWLSFRHGWLAMHD
jgi:predicted secreted protein